MVLTYFEILMESLVLFHMKDSQCSYNHFLLFPQISGM